MITTTLYGFLKPQDNDSADLRIYVGQNMDLIESAISYVEANALYTVDWIDLTGKPTTFNPSPHTHAWSEIGEVPTFDNYIGWDIIVGATTKRIATLDSLTVNATGYSIVDFNSTTNTMTINTIASPNNYLTNVSGSANGVATFTREGLQNLTWNTEHIHSANEVTSGVFDIGRIPTTTSINSTSEALVPTASALKFVNDSLLTHIANTSNPHMVTSEQINAIGKLPETTPPKDFPVGVSVMDGANSGYPTTYCTVVVYKQGNFRAVQEVHDKSKSLIYQRTAVDGESWGAWMLLVSEDRLSEISIGASTWDEITGKPTTFTPSIHTHTWTEITGKPTTFTPSIHTHSISEVIGLQTVVNDVGTLSGRVDTLEQVPVGYSNERKTYQAINAGTYTDIVWDNNIFHDKQNGNIVTTSNSTSYTIQQSGLYAVNCVVGLTGIGSSTGFSALTFWIGSKQHFLASNHYRENGNFAISGSAYVKLNVGDVLKFSIYCSNVANIVGVSAHARTHFQLIRIR